ncbi:hypothetical protein HZH68_015579 [Vespula germanica]|uniref:D-beta-hydroxybutyrate dehydrogenase, mitochondrial n=1 Tax=Vespula germanica TaxID=30212 RepID=A0A834J9X5_VESGE|nr:hypothetical protein HZH68_015579 [Vespula germanica]
MKIRPLTLTLKKEMNDFFDAVTLLMMALVSEISTSSHVTSGGSSGGECEDAAECLPRAGLARLAARGRHAKLEEVYSIRAVPPRGHSNREFLKAGCAADYKIAMDVETGAILALQILALCSIAAALLAYLMRQSRNAGDEYELRNKRHVLVTNCDTCVGLQIALALSEAGYKVFAGLPNPLENSPSMKVLKAVEQEREKEMDNNDASNDKIQLRTRGQIVPLELDPTREDSLHASLDAVRAKLPAGEDGKRFDSNLILFFIISH